MAGVVLTLRKLISAERGQASYGKSAKVTGLKTEVRP